MSPIAKNQTTLSEARLLWREAPRYAGPDRYRQLQDLRTETHQILEAFRDSIRLSPNNAGESDGSLAAALNTIAEKQAQISGSDPDTLATIRTDVFQEVSPYLAKAETVLKKRFPDLQILQFSPDGLGFMLGEQRAEAVVRSDGITQIRSRGAIIVCSPPLTLEELNTGDRNAIGKILNNLAAYFTPEVLTGLMIYRRDKLRYEFDVTINYATRHFVATPDDILEVIDAPQEADAANFRKAQDKLAAAKQELNHANEASPSNPTRKVYAKTAFDKAEAALRQAGNIAFRRILKSSNGMQVIEQGDVTGETTDFFWAYSEKGAVKRTITFSRGASSITSAEDADSMARQYMAEHAVGLPRPNFEDPALTHWADVRDEWIDWARSGMPDMTRAQANVWRLQMKAMIARNLFLRNRDVNQDTVRQEFARILALRDAYANTPLFRGRNILFMAHSEMLRDVRKPDGSAHDDMTYAQWEMESDDSHRFGKSALRSAIRAQQGEADAFEFIRPEKTPASLRDAKEAMLSRIRTLPRPATFIFDGHGTPDAIHLSGGGGPIDPRPPSNVPKVMNEEGGAIRGFGVLPNDSKSEGNDECITLDELATALNERSRNLPTSDLAARDILIFQSCYNSTFLRKLYGKLTGEPRPISLGASEYGQLAYSDLRSPLGGAFFSETLQLKRKNAIPATFADVFRNEFNGVSNPSLFIADAEGFPIQISRRNMGDAQVSSAA